MHNVAVRQYETVRSKHESGTAAARLPRMLSCSAVFGNLADIDVHYGWADFGRGCGDCLGISIEKGVIVRLRLLYQWERLTSSFGAGNSSKGRF